VYKDFDTIAIDIAPADEVNHFELN